MASQRRCQPTRRRNHYARPGDSSFPQGHQPKYLAFRIMWLSLSRRHHCPIGARYLLIGIRRIHIRLGIIDVLGYCCFPRPLLIPDLMHISFSSLGVFCLVSSSGTPPIEVQMQKLWLTRDVLNNRQGRWPIRNSISITSGKALAMLYPIQQEEMLYNEYNMVQERRGPASMSITIPTIEDTDTAS